MRTFIAVLVLLLAGCVNNSSCINCDDQIAGNSVCNSRSHADCKGEWVGTECGPRGRGYTCTDNGNGGILSPECSCLNGQGDPPPENAELEYKGEAL